MEQWNGGILGPFMFHLVENNGVKMKMDPKSPDPNTQVVRFQSIIP